MKKLLSSIALAIISIASLHAQAATATGPSTFDVTINLTSKCEIQTVPTAAFTYTSFSATAVTMPASSFNVRCTNNLPIASILLDNGAGGAATGLTQGYTDAATNLAYSLTLGSVPTAGTGIAQTVSLTGTMAAGQAGTCATASCTNTSSGNKTRTITLSY